MIFKQLYELEHGLKTETCRVAKPGDMVEFGDGDSYPVEGLVESAGYFKSLYYEDDRYPYAVYDKNMRLKAQVGKDYAIVPKRGQGSVGQYKLLRIRVHRIQDMTEDVAIAEGFHLDGEGHYWTSVFNLQSFDTALQGYETLWKNINTTKPHRWQDNPIVIRYGIQVLRINGKAVSE